MKRTQWHAPHITQPLHDGDDFLDDVVDLGLRREPANAEPERGVRHVLRSAKRTQDI